MQINRNIQKLWLQNQLEIIIEADKNIKLPLNIYEIGILRAIASKQNTPNPHTSYAWLARINRCAKNTVIDHIKSLIQKGFLTEINKLNWNPTMSKQYIVEFETLINHLELTVKELNKLKQKLYGEGVPPDGTWCTATGYRGIPPGGTLNINKYKNIKKEKYIKRKSSLPDDFYFDDKHEALAREYGLNVREEFEQFKSHALMNDRKLANWGAGFSNWLRNAKKFQRNAANAKQTKPNVADQLGWIREDIRNERAASTVPFHPLLDHLSKKMDG